MMLVQEIVLVFATLTVLIQSHTIPGLGSLHIQDDLSKRANLIDPVYENLKDSEIDFINTHMTNLTNYNTTSDCDLCKFRLRYAKSLIDDYPDQSHLTSLLLFKYCIESNKEKKINVIMLISLSPLIQRTLINLMMISIQVLHKLVDLTSMIMISCIC